MSDTSERFITEYREYQRRLYAAQRRIKDLRIRGNDVEPSTDQEERLKHRHKAELVAIGVWAQGRPFTNAITALIHLLVKAHQEGRDITLYKEAVDQLNADSEHLVNQH